MNALRVLLALLIAVTMTACGGGGSEVAPDLAIRVYLFAGQSNMLGSDATIAPVLTLDLAEVGLQTEVDRAGILALKAGPIIYKWGDIRGHAGYAMSRAAVNGKAIKVHGPEVGFNREIGPVAIIKYATNWRTVEAGRSPWAGGGIWAAWQEFNDAQLASLGRPYVIAGFVWHQGIDDGLAHRTQAEYVADLRKIVADLRAKYGPVPFVLARSFESPIAGSAAMAPIRAGQMEVGADPGNAWIDVDDLPKVNHHHLSSAGQLEAGRRFAVAMNGLMK